MRISEKNDLSSTARIICRLESQTSLELSTGTMLGITGSRSTRHTAKLRKGRLHFAELLPNADDAEE